MIRRTWSRYGIIRAGELFLVSPPDATLKIVENEARYKDEVIPIVIYEGISAAPQRIDELIEEISKMSVINPNHYCTNLTQKQKAEMIVDVVLKNLGISELP